MQSGGLRIGSLDERTGTNCRSLYPNEMSGEPHVMGKKKGNGRDGVQPNPDELKSWHRAESRAQTSPTELPARSTKPKVAGSNPVGRAHESPAAA
jgi:hypothetical protein